MCVVVGYLLSACKEIVPAADKWHVSCNKYLAPREALVCAIRHMSAWSDDPTRASIETLYEILAKKDPYEKEAEI